MKNASSVETQTPPKSLKSGLQFPQTLWSACLTLSVLEQREGCPLSLHPLCSPVLSRHRESEEARMLLTCFSCRPSTLSTVPEANPLTSELSLKMAWVLGSIICSVNQNCPLDNLPTPPQKKRYFLMCI